MVQSKVVGTSSALDLDHLSRQTLGNRTLEREVLGLFVSHADEQLARLARSAPGRERRESAHAIVGSARAIGAFDVARIAGEIEQSSGAVEVELAELAEAVGKAREFIARLLEK